MRVSMLVENQKIDGNIPLKKEHGLSLYLQVHGKKILFDTGASGVFIDNAKKMGVDIEDIDYVVISHGHFDHGGGLARLLEVNKKAQVYMRSGADKEYYVRLFFFNKDVSIPRNVFSKFQDRIHFVDSFAEITEDVFLVTEIEQKYPLVNFSKNLLVKENGVLSRDAFDHELVTVVRDGERLIVFTGCSHNGIDNMIEAAMEAFPSQRIGTVIGGFHLVGMPVINMFVLSGKAEEKGVRLEIFLYVYIHC